MTSALDRYTRTLEKSRLIEPDELARRRSEFQARHAAHPTNDEVSAFGLALVTAGLLTPWQQEKLAQGHSKGFFLGQYKLLGLLGVGGMGAVYLAEHVLMRRRVAIKVLPARLVKDAAYLERFHREAQAIASLDHPNIIQAYNVDNEGDLHYLVMQYIEGRDLEQIVNESGPLAPARAARFIRQAADGLAHAHARGLIHRDVKPSNLLVDALDTVRVLDLGLARSVSQELSPSGAGPEENVVGTTDYLAPEQALASRDLDGRADIYSLGCTLYFLLTGRPPFPEGTLAEKLMKHQMESPAPIAALRADISPELAAVCARMMEKQPADRYATADAVSESLGALYPPEPGERGASTVSRGSTDDTSVDPRLPEWSFANPSSNEGSDGEVSAIRVRQARDQKAKLLVVAGIAMALLTAVGIWGATRGRSRATAEANPDKGPHNGIDRTAPAKRARFAPKSAESLWPGSQTKGDTKADPAPAVQPPTPEPAKTPAVVDLSRKQSVFTLIEEARDYTLVYHLKIPDEAGFNSRGVPYTVDNRPEIRQPFDRVAYCLELQRPGGEVQFAYASWETVTQDLGLLGVPCSATKVRVQGPIKDLNVFSNVPGVSTGTALRGGVEFWDVNYGANNTAKVPDASDKDYDFGDAMSNSGDYGSMQIHNWEARQTVLAYNRWGSGNGEAGIGNQPTGNPDWTFSNNIRGYTLKELYVLVRLKGEPGK